MSRVFSAMTGTSAARAVPAAPIESPRAEFADDTFVADAEGAPFVEVGGRGGTVFSPPKPKVEEPRAFPRIAADAPAAPATPAAAYLSVRFHDAAPRAPERPAGGPDASLVALHFPDHPVSAEYRTLRDEIAAQLIGDGPRALTFTAANPEAGTTTVLANLAVTLARDGRRVLLLDANVTRPGAAQKFALRAAPGLAEVLTGSLPLTWALQPTPVANLQVLAAGTAAEGLAPVLGRDLPKLVDQLRQWFDWVLIDAGVWGVVPERDGTCSSADAVYLVTREADAERPEFIGLRARVKHLGGALRGYVATRA
ncbi:MAG: CpsD/CapB family tyrosine-protein kinase [Planctomycetes bacterium]|nr:CpsD/CapB family tyrosine-protein kinase [Planctomycetota bacterium]